MGIVRKVPVTDRHGDEFILYEVQDRRLFRKVRRLMLETGERVEPLDSDTFVIASTGERLIRVP